jgi:hypothetical protein
MDLLTKRQLACLAKLPENYTVVGATDGSPVVRRPDGQLLRIQPNGNLAATTLVKRVQSYLSTERA